MYLFLHFRLILFIFFHDHTTRMVDQITQNEIIK